LLYKNSNGINWWDQESKGVLDVRVWLIIHCPEGCSQEYFYGLGCSSVVQQLPSMHEALCSIPAPKKKRQKKKKRKNISINSTIECSL
jgi:hypothetical protein